MVRTDGVIQNKDYREGLHQVLYRPRNGIKELTADPVTFSLTCSASACGTSLYRSFLSISSLCILLLLLVF